ncbi:MAG TPA: urea ABC transporter permease subunit UrtB, partial [Arcobacter sp.]|nr:urea ABC transporter permease subunit UrtB [Arcobacter sp.]
MKKLSILIFLNLFFLFSLHAKDFTTDLKPLTKNSFKTKEVVVNNLASNDSENEILPLLFKSMLDGNLHYLKNSKEFVIVTKKEGKTYYITDLLTGKVLEPVYKKMVKKVKTNNKLRSIIRTKLSELTLFSQDVDKRYMAAKNILENLESDSKELVTKALLKEKEKKVKEVLIEADTVLKALYGNSEEQLKAIEDLGQFLSPTALQTLNEVKASTKDETLIELCDASIESIETSKSFYSVLETAFFGLSQGSVLLLAAIGLAITFGVMKVINMAHGEMMMIGAYTTFTLQQIM